MENHKRKDQDIERAQDSSRCFVALAPDPRARAHLDALARHLHARFPASRRVDADNLHLTLAFIGLLDHERMRTVVGALREIQEPALSWTLDRIGSFPRAGVVWAGGESGQGLDLLAQEVRTLLDRLHVGFDRKRFAPHVTLLRTRAPFPEDSFCDAIEWTIGRPRLFVSGRDRENRILYRPCG